MIALHGAKRTGDSRPVKAYFSGVCTLTVSQCLFFRPQSLIMKTENNWNGMKYSSQACVVVCQARPTVNIS